MVQKKIKNIKKEVTKINKKGKIPTNSKNLYFLLLILFAITFIAFLL